MSEITIPVYGRHELVASVVSSFIGAELTGKLKNPPCDNFCPDEITQIVNFYLEKAYNKGVCDMFNEFRMLSLVAELPEHDLTYNWHDYKKDRGL